MSNASGSRDSSPDPITLPSSPIVPHSAKSQRFSPLQSRDSNALPSPSRAPRLRPVLPRMEGRSPLRSEVFPETVPQPRRPNRTSPSKRRRIEEELVENVELRQPRRRRRAQEANVQQLDVGGAEEAQLLTRTATHEAKRKSPHRANRSPTTRVAALRGSARKRPRESSATDRGDNTVSQNEDFSMISMESLQSAKEASLLSLSGARRLAPILERSIGHEASAAAVSYLPSSPPRNVDSSPVQYPDIEQAASVAKNASNQDAAYDAMSWRATGPATTFANKSLSNVPMLRPDSQLRQWDNGEPSWRPSDAMKLRDDEIRRDSGQDPIVFGFDDALEISSDEEEVTHPVMEMVDNQRSEAPVMDDDIWQEEASRSVHSSNVLPNHQIGISEIDPQPTRANERPRSPQNIDDLFADQPIKPPRAKIPRTWRRSSGMDFAYSDSPAHGLQQSNRPNDIEHDHDEAEEVERKGSADGSRILTPPSTDDGGRGQGSKDADPSSEIFQPDAEATRFQSDVVYAEEDEEANADDEIYDEDGVGDADGDNEAEGSDASGDASPDHDDADDTGLFFQNNMPQLFTRSTTALLAEQPRRRPRPRKRETDNLTELLNLDGAWSPEKVAPVPTCDQPSARKITNSSFVERMEQRKKYGRPLEVQEARMNLDEAQGHTAEKLASPVRKSLLKSSKTDPDQTTGSEISTNRYVPRRQRLNRAADVELRHQAQKICEQNRAGQLLQQDDLPPAARNKDAPPDDLPTQTDASQSTNGPIITDTGISTSFRSYEERLNKASPGKVQVNFNDSSSALRLSPKKHTVPPLFDHRRVASRPLVPQARSPPEMTLVDKQATSKSEQGFFSRLSTTFWSAVTWPAEKVEEPIPSQPQLPKIVLKVKQDTTSADLEESSLLEGTFPSARRSKLRARYGVLSSTFPWKLYHMRTLHRLYNSAFGRSDSLVPTSGALPDALAVLVGSQQPSINGGSYTFTRAHAYVIQAFLSLLVPEEIVVGMQTGEVEFLGDRLAGELRGSAAKGDEVLRRNGMMAPAWMAKEDGTGPGHWVNKLSGEFSIPFVVRVLGDIVAHEQGLQESRQRRQT